VLWHVLVRGVIPLHKMRGCWGGERVLVVFLGLPVSVVSKLGCVGVRKYM